MCTEKIISDLQNRLISMQNKNSSFRLMQKLSLSLSLFETASSLSLFFQLLISPLLIPVIILIILRVFRFLKPFYLKFWKNGKFKKQRNDQASILFELGFSGKGVRGIRRSTRIFNIVAIDFFLYIEKLLLFKPA